MRTATCQLCLQHRPLCDSHALPLSIFNCVLRTNSGKAIVIVDDDSTPVQYSSDTWDAELLRRDCEQLLNKNHDAYGIAVFRGYEGQIHRDAQGVTFLRIDQRKLRMFFLSVLWRISISSHPNYSNVGLPFLWEEDLRDALCSGKTLPEHKFTVAVRKLHDPTRENGLSNEDLRGFIAAPFGREFGRFISVSYTFLGFFVEVFLPHVPRGYRKRPSVIYGDSPVFFAPSIDVFQIPEIADNLINAVRKHDAGLSRVK